MFASWLDRVLYRHPFEGASARRYREAERPGFGDLDDRLLDGMALDGRKYLLDLGAGPATFAARAAARYPQLGVIAIDPSRDFARAHAGIEVVRAVGEALPLADASVDVAMCLSSIRHVRDRSATLRELRRVVRSTLFIVELDPAASSARIANHADRFSSSGLRTGRVGTAVLRRTFGPLVVRTAPAAAAIEALAVAAGWTLRALRDDPVQPVYIMELA
jgi:SAM-dependent methyltransferase